MQQINLFEELEKRKDIYKEIKKVVDKYGVDRYYKKYLTDRTYNFNEIKTALYKLRNYDEYLEVLFNELKKYFKEIKVDDKNYYKPGQEAVAKDKRAIIIHKDNVVGPVYCLKMTRKYLEEE